jgi:hypothetical protein
LTPPDNSRTSASVSVTACFEALPSDFTCWAMQPTRAEPTTAPSAALAIASACSAVLMPNPTTTGNCVCRFSRATAAETSALAAERVPVMPAIAT